MKCNYKFLTEKINNHLKNGNIPHRCKEFKVIRFTEFVIKTQEIIGTIIQETKPEEFSIVKFYGNTNRNFFAKAFPARDLIL